MFMDLIGQANRSSTSFYTVDAAGLRTETRPHTATPLEAMVEARNRERVPYSTRLDSIRTLGESTNGMAIVDTNNFAAGLRRAAADFNSYYLLGYTSTNGKPDGKYRKIRVTVKRPGVQVRAREGLPGAPRRRTSRRRLDVERREPRRERRIRPTRS